jgi:arylsulfatase A-like enzyme/Flp pilus assembly protein TadD
MTLDYTDPTAGSPRRVSFDMARPSRPTPERRAASARATARPRRTKSWRLITAAGLVAAAVVAWWAWPGRSGSDPIVLVSIDTLRADRLPIYGHAGGSTPSLDAFAAESVVFDRAYAHAPQTLPSHASIFTGRLPFEHTVRDNLGFVLPAGATTLAGLLTAAGFATGGFPSAYVLRPETGIAQGFATYDAALPASGADQAIAEIVRTGPDTLAAALRWLDGLERARPFLFFHLYEPHTPYAPPARFTQPDKYDGEVSYADEIVGQLFAALKARGLYDAATIIVTADHGEGLGDHVEEEHGLFVYEETIRVPLLVRLPGGSHGGARVATPVQHIDLLPTVLSRTGLPRPEGLGGRDLSPLLEATGPIEEQGIYAEAMYSRYHFGWSELSALVDARYKFILAPRVELYDLGRDGSERANIAGDRTTVAGAMRAGLDRLTAGRALNAPAAVSAEDRERLAALGYIGSSGGSPLTTPASTLPDPKDKVATLQAYRDAVTRLSERDFAGGLAKLEAVLNDSPDMIDAWVRYANVLARVGRLGDALSAFREVVKRKPTDPGGLFGAASVLSQLGRLPEARQHAELALKVSPAQAHQTLAHIALAEKRPDEALRQAELAAAADPTLPAATLIRGLIAYRAGQYREAVPLLLEARDAYGKRTLQEHELNFFIADALARLERYADAEPFFREELRLYPQNTRAREGLAMLYQATERAAEADRVLQDMVRAATAPQHFARAAELYAMFGRPDRAAEVRAAMRKRFAR